MISPEIGSTLELKTFGGVVGRVAVDVQKALIENGLLSHAIDFNKRLSVALYNTQKNLEASLPVVSRYTERDLVSEPVEVQVRAVERFIVNSHANLKPQLERKYQEFLSSNKEWPSRGIPKAITEWISFYRMFRAFKAEVRRNPDKSYDLVIPKPPYKLSTGIEIPWGEPAQVAGRRIGALGSHDLLEDLATVPSEYSSTDEKASFTPSVQGYTVPTKHDQIGAAFLLRSDVTPRPRFVLVIPSRILVSTPRHRNEVVPI